MQMVVGCQDYDFRELEQVTEKRVLFCARERCPSQIQSEGNC